MDKKNKEILKEIYKQLGYADYYIDHPDEITDFHGTDLQEVCITAYSIGFNNAKLSSHFKPNTK